MNRVHIDSHATATLRYIRASMEAAASIAVPGSAGLAMGSVGVAAMVLSCVPTLQEQWLGIWLLAAVVASGFGGALMMQSSSPRGSILARAQVRKLALCLLPSLFGGAIMTTVLWSSNNLQAIPGTWLLSYGCALVPASITTNPKVAYMGTSFAVLGLLAFPLPWSLQMLMLGAGFGGLHLLFGFLIGQADHDGET